MPTLNTLQSQDAFTRADGSLHGSTMTDGTSTWGTPTDGVWEVTINAAFAPTAADAGIVVSSMSAIGSQRVSAKINGNNLGVLARHNGTMSNAAATYYGLLITGSQAGIWRRDAGSFTQLVDFGASTWASGDVMSLEVIGSTLEAFRNGTSLGTTTDATYSTGVCGMWSNNNGVTFDDFEVFVGSSASLHRLVGPRCSVLLRGLV